MRSTDATTRLLVDLVSGRPVSGDGVDWVRALEGIESLGLAGLAVAEHRASPFLPGPVVEALEPAYLGTALRTTLIVEGSRRAAEALERAGVPVLLYKGAALVESGVYPDPGARAMDDADLLVPSARATDAVRALREAGFSPWVDWDPRTVGWLDSATFRDTRAPGGAEIDVDLHWRLGYGGLRYGADGGEAGAGTGEERLWNSADRARHLPAPEAHLAIVAEHVLKHFHVRVHLPGVLDVVRLSREIRDWEAVRAQLASHPGGRGLSALLDLVRRGFAAPIPPKCLERAGSGTARRLARTILTPERLLARATEGGARLRGLLYRWLLAGSVGRALGEVRATVLPGSRWLRARYGAGAETARAYPLGLLLRYWKEIGRWLAGRGVSPVSPNQEFEG